MWSEHFNPRGSKLNRQWQPIQAVADLSLPVVRQGLARAAPGAVPDLLCQKLAALGGARVALSGGEALQHSQFDELVEIVQRRGLVCTALFSNGWSPARAIGATPSWTQVLFSHSPAVGQGLSPLQLAEIARVGLPGRLITLSSMTLDGSEIPQLWRDAKELASKCRARIRWRIGVVRPVGRGASLPIVLPTVERAYAELFRRWDEEVRPADLLDLQIGFAFRSDFVRRGRIRSPRSIPSARPLPDPARAAVPGIPELSSIPGPLISGLLTVVRRGEPGDLYSSLPESLYAPLSLRGGNGN